MTKQQTITQISHAIAEGDLAKAENVLEDACKDKAIGFVGYMEDGHFFTSKENDVRYYHYGNSKYTKEELYLIFSNPTL